MTSSSDAQALRMIADQMEDWSNYAPDEMGIEALCLRNAADRLDRLTNALRPLVENCKEHCFDECQSYCDKMTDCKTYRARVALYE